MVTRTDDAPGRGARLASLGCRAGALLVVATAVWGCTTVSEPAPPAAAPVPSTSTSVSTTTTTARFEPVADATDPTVVSGPRRPKHDWTPVPDEWDSPDRGEAIEGRLVDGRRFLVQRRGERPCVAIASRPFLCRPWDATTQRVVPGFSFDMKDLEGDPVLVFGFVPAGAVDLVMSWTDGTTDAQIYLNAEIWAVPMPPGRLISSMVFLDGDGATITHLRRDNVDKGWWVTGAEE